MENKICQSCGMPITSNEQLGTNQDAINFSRLVHPEIECKILIK